MAHFEQQLTSKNIYSGKIIGLNTDTVRLENGREVLREVVVHHGGVGILPVDRDGNLLLVRQFRYPTGGELLEIPAGKMEQGEDPRQCGIRELEEEVGCRAGVFESMGKMWPTPAYDTELDHLFYATELTPARQHLDDDEFLDVERIPLEQAVRMVLEGAIPDAKTQLAVLKFAALRQRGLEVRRPGRMDPASCG